MFAYCNNNPVNCCDEAGCAPSCSDDENDNGIPDYLEKRWYEMTLRYKNKNSKSSARNVTDEMNSALTVATKRGKEVYSQQYACENRIMFDWLTIKKYYEFKDLVDHFAPWDIKQKDSWNSTIGTDFPGEGAIVVYNDQYITPEMLGNYAYGALGRSYGIPLWILLTGSYNAAKCPMRGTCYYDNEMLDWVYIANGYNNWK